MTAQEKPKIYFTNPMRGDMAKKIESLESEVKRLQETVDFLRVTVKAQSDIIEKRNSRNEVRLAKVQTLIDRVRESESRIIYLYELESALASKIESKEELG